MRIGLQPSWQDTLSVGDAQSLTIQYKEMDNYNYFHARNVLLYVLEQKYSTKCRGSLKLKWEDTKNLSWIFKHQIC
jgi:hypothetical protein